MKKLLLILLLGLSAYYSQGQTLRINKYLVDSMISAGVQVLYYDTTHTGQWKNISEQAGGGGSGANNYTTSVAFTNNRLTVNRNGLSALTADWDSSIYHSMGFYDLRYAPIGGGVSDGNKGDITVSSSGAVWTINNLAVTNAKIADSTIRVAKLYAVGTKDSAHVLAGNDTWKETIQYTFTLPANGDLLQYQDGEVINYTPTYISNVTGLISAGTNVSITGTGTSGSPYVISASGGAADVTDSIQQHGSSFPAFGSGNIYLDTVARRFKYRIISGADTIIYTLAIQDSTISATPPAFLAEFLGANGTALSAYTPEYGTIYGIAGTPTLNGSGFVTLGSGEEFKMDVNLTNQTISVTKGSFPSGASIYVVIREIDASHYI
jgi:hypothetical protein